MLLIESAWGWHMPSMRAVLETRRKAAAVRVEELEAELERVRTDLAEAEEVLKLRTIGLEQYLEALAGEGQPAEMVVGPSPRKPVGPRQAVPHRENAAGVAVRTLTRRRVRGQDRLDVALALGSLAFVKPAIVFIGSH
ncbi:hypothetical protein M2160_000145 [Streptomyces sp. SAI-117]|nr:hypothetical protein [Streptomyces sp. SAI-117]